MSDIQLQINDKQINTIPIINLLRQGENNADTILMQLPPQYGEIALGGLTYIMYGDSKSGTRATQVLEKEANSEGVLLRWKISEDFTAVAGELKLTLKGFLLDGNPIIKWVGGTINVYCDPAGGLYPPPVSEIEQALKEMYAVLGKAEQSAQSAATSEQNARTSADDARVSANNAQASATKAEQIAQSVQGEAQKIEQVTQAGIAAIDGAGNEAISNIQLAGEGEVSKIAAAGSAEVQKVATEGAKQVQAATEQANLAKQSADSAASKVQEVAESVAAGKQEIATARDSALSAVQGEGGKQVQAVNTAGTAQVQAVGAEGQKQVAAVQAEGQKQAEEIKAIESLLPAPTTQDAGKVPMVDAAGTGYELGDIAQIAKNKEDIAAIKGDLKGLLETVFPQKETDKNKSAFYIINHSFDIDSKIVVCCSGKSYGLSYTKSGSLITVADYGLTKDTVISVSKGDRIDVIQIKPIEACSVSCKVIGDKIQKESIPEGLVVHNYGTLVKQYYQNIGYNPVYQQGDIRKRDNYFITNPLPIIKGKDIYIDSTYTANAIFYDENGDYLGFENIYYGKPILYENVYENAYYIAFSIQIGSPAIDATKLNTNTFSNKYMRRSVSMRNYMAGTRLKTHIYKSDSIDTIVAKMNEALATENVDVYWEYGTYNLNGLYDVLKSQYSFSGQTPRGIYIGGNCRYFFGNATLTKDMSDVPADSNYSSDILEGVSSDIAENCDFEIYDLNIHGTGITYCIHDDVKQQTLSKNSRKYSNCTMRYTANERSTYLSKCIGGGTGKICYREVENCNFYMDGSNPSISKMQEVSFHGALSYPDEAYLELKVRDCYFEHGIGQHGLSQNQTANFYMSGCSLDEYSKPSEESGWKSYVWNNEIRKEQKF